MDEVEFHSVAKNSAKQLEPFETELMEYTSYVDTTTIKSKNSDQVKAVMK